MAYSFIRLSADDGSWDAFEADWRAQCEQLEEDFESYAGLTFSAVENIVKQTHAKAGVFALKDDDSHVVMCQVNCAPIPKYVGPVLRTRFITFSPDYDLTDEYLHLYSRALVELLFGVLELGMSGGEFSSRHLKLHLQSPEDAKFFTAVERNLKGHALFESVETRGQWLYMSRK
ncbi:hypothetical protein AGRO_2635 [Agrobacterium sp. ATCC 31749]|uniref:hypothetical protein n=1 Tax=unclassified Agrobacterium TaxID=2632611 RepID=UPI00020DBCAD|nr:MULTISPECIES: hypothetical protein [unclassified Agrobacterium]EGL64426.1 hypothetical protein AGRO_2635 [Agrobacterium sp. ATCC 31749]QKW95804.1 hypothetical protein GSF67_01035 [Agrobacterium sp. CGMCC 11546]